VKKTLFILLFFNFIQGFAQKTYNTGLDFDDAAYKHTPVNKPQLKRNYENLPAKVDLKPYCPTPQLQADKSTCVGWAIGYAACTITEGVAKNITDKAQLNDMASSADFVYAFGKKPSDTECSKGIVMDETLTKLYGRTIPRKKNFKMLCTTTALPTPNGEGIKIKQNDDWGFKLAQVKKSLLYKKPVVVGIESSKSFFDTKDVWDGNTTNFKGGHALCIIGYDDNFQGGAVEVMNSWGTEWGQGGFGWIKYTDLQKVLKYAYDITTDFSTAEQSPVKQIGLVAKTPELSSKISLKLSTGTEIPLVLKENIERRGLKPVKIALENTNDIPSVSTSSTSFLKAQYKTVQGYPSSTRYRVYLEMSQPLYLYVLGSDMTGQVAALFPPDETISPYLSNKNTAIALPDEQWFIEMDETKGKDFMLVLYSLNPIPVSNLIEELNKQTGSFLDKISKKLGSKFQLMDSSILDKNAVRFQMPLKTDKIQALCLEIEHN
jgi:Papain family cysteine protease